jgi:hypothetical protein
MQQVVAIDEQTILCSAANLQVNALQLRRSLGITDI